MISLLDVNVLIALLDPAHLHHEIAHDWFARHERYGWATTGITVAGCVRILCSPAFRQVHAQPADVVRSLQQACKSPHHHHWPDSTSLLDGNVFRAEMIDGHQKITDVLLLAIACQHDGRLVTFDRSISLKPVIGATARNLLVIGSGLQ
jgi:uncharacterized protein